MTALLAVIKILLGKNAIKNCSIVLLSGLLLV